jgi:hypothetical protein
MSTELLTRGRWLNRLAIQSLTVILAVLLYWLLGFLVEDIESIEGPIFDNKAVPSLEEIEGRHIDARLLERKVELEQAIAQRAQEIKKREQEQRFTKDSAQNLERTISQLLELQKLSIQKDATLSGAQQADFSNSLEFFLESQRRYQELNQELSTFLGEKTILESELSALKETISKQRQPAQEEHKSLLDEYRRKYGTQVDAHRLKLAFMQLSVLIPALALVGYLVARKRQSIYFAFVMAFGAACVTKVGQVLHRYFPEKYFKYILIAALILVAARILIYFIRTVVSPKRQLLLKQYREAYERFLCPVCDYPIRVGPRRFLYWTRRTVKKVVPQTNLAGSEETYTCPSCGTLLFEECAHCKAVRYSLLPHCQHCGAEKQIN